MAPRTLACPLHSLRPILHIEWPESVLSCSKGSRGLFVPSRVIGIFTDTTISLGSWLRQCPDHYTIRAGRNLPDKEFRYLRTVIVTVSGCILHLSSLHSPVFLVNSCLDLFSAPRSHEDPFSRSYGVSLPSSLTMNLPTPQYVLHNHVCPFAVRVPYGLSLADFLGSLVTRTISLPRRGCRTVRFGSGSGFACPRQHLHPSTEYSVTPRRFHCSVSTIAPYGSNGMLTVSAIALAVRLRLRTRLTPG